MTDYKSRNHLEERKVSEVHIPARGAFLFAFEEVNNQKKVLRKLYIDLHDMLLGIMHLMAASIYI